MTLTLEEAMASVWRQALVDKAKVIELAGKTYPVRATAKRGLRQIDFVFKGEELRALEQNPKTQSRWAQLARAGKKVMQFLQQGRYIGVVVDGKVTLYGRRPDHRAAAAR